MTGFGTTPSASYESMSAPINYRDASSSSGVHWKHPPTPISAPTNNERPSRAHDDLYSIGSDTTRTRRPGNPNVGQTLLAKYDVPLRAHDNPYFRDTGSKHRRPGKPNVTVPSKPTHGIITDPHARKRQKLDHGLSSNGVYPSSARRPIARSNVSELDVQLIEPPRGTDNPRNDAEIIDVESSDDLGERVPRAPEPSPDPLNIHPFDTHPTGSISIAMKKGKERAKDVIPLVVQDSEEEDIEQFPSPSRTNRPSDSKKSPGIPKNFVRERRSLYEKPSTPVSAPAASWVPAAKTVDFVNRTITSSGTHGRVVSLMKGKNGSTHKYQTDTSTVDQIGTSSSNFVNSKLTKESPVLPLEACSIGYNLFRHSNNTPLKLVYEPARGKVKVIWDQSPPEKIEFKLDRDVNFATVVNDDKNPLKENVLIQFVTTAGKEWKEVERRYKGFKGGGDRAKGNLTFLFSTKNDRVFSATDYQRFVTGIKQAIEGRAVETIGPPKGAILWQYTSEYAEMFEQTESRKKENYSESTADGPSVVTRSVTPGSSTSVQTRVSCADSKPQNGDSGSSMPQRRSARHSVIRPSGISSPAPPPPQLEPDEVILLYPPTGTGGLSIMHSDLKRLEPEEYLNDTLIEFGLKLWLNDLRQTDPTLADQIHVFSSFFYKKLNNKKNPEEGYQSVRKWTSKVDLFAKKFVIVPINENIHWYLAVIYEPGHTLEPPLPPLDASNARLTRKRKQTQERVELNVEVVASEPVPIEVSLKRLYLSSQAVEGEQETDVSSMNATRATTPSAAANAEMVVDKPHSLNVGSELVSTTSQIQTQDFFSSDLTYPPSEYMDVDPEISNSLSGIPAGQFYGLVPEPEEAQPAVVADGEDSIEDQEQEAEVDNMLTVTQSSGDSVQTRIFTFDSLGSRHPQAIKVLGRYLEWEAKDKRNFDEVRVAVGKQVQVPVQPNTWDCGIYLLHFVKVFMSAPLEIVDQILSTRGTMPSFERRKMWQDHEIPRSRDILKSRIVGLSDEWKAEKNSEASKRQNGDAMEVEELSSEGEVDIVEDIPVIKSTSRPRQKRPAMRLRG